MRCPKCGGRTRVADVRHPESNDTLRSRVCAICGHVFHTIEFPAISDTAFMNCWVKSYRPTTRYRKNKEI